MKAFGIIETILRNRFPFFVEIRDNIELDRKARQMIVASMACLFVYGAVLGSTHSALQALSSAVKLPVLFLATTAICAPTLYFFGVLLGSSQTLPQSVCLLLTAITVSAVLLLAFAPVTLFFLLATGNYQFFKLLNVVIFAVVGLRGTRFLSQGMAIVANNAESANSRRTFMRLWVMLYGLVGSQMAWTLRPFVGAPSLPFELFRSLGGTFFANVIGSLGEVLGFWMVR